MTRISEETVREALARVIEPRSGRSLVELGMISGLVIRDGNVGFAIEIDPKRSAEFEPLRKLAEQSVLALEGVSSVTAVLTAHSEAGEGETARPQPSRPSPQRPHGSPAAPRGGGGQPAPLAPEVRAIIAVASGKGGVGKSTTATNLALAYARLGLKAGVLDADIYGPSQPRMLGVSGRPETREGKRLEPMENFGVKVMSMGFLVAEDAPMIWRGPMVQSAIQQMLRDVEWGPLDVLVVDMPPGTGDAQLTLAQQVPLAGAIIITTPQDISLIDAKKGLNMFRKVNVPVLGIVENMSYFLCPHCGGRSEIFSHGGGEREAQRLGCDFLGEIPLDIVIRETSDSGNPIVVSQPESGHAQAYMEIARRSWATVEPTLAKDAPGGGPKIIMN